MSQVTVTILAEIGKQESEYLEVVQLQAYEAILGKYPEAENFRWEHRDVAQLNGIETVGLGLKGPGTYYWLRADTGGTARDDA